MCGIFGFSAEARHTKQLSFKKIINSLFLYSEIRGKEAAGLCVQNGAGTHVYKQPIAASLMIKKDAYAAFTAKYLKPSASEDHLTVLGHSRLVTNGAQSFNCNNQPVLAQSVVGVHNGIVVNHEDFWHEITASTKQTDLDSEAIFALLDDRLQKGEHIVIATRELLAKVKGSMSIATVFAKLDVLMLATNTGSLYYCYSDKFGIIFASEEIILKKILRQAKLRVYFNQVKICKLAAGNILLYSYQSHELTVYESSAEQSLHGADIASLAEYATTDHCLPETPEMANIRRCSKCILPATMPFIDFDEQGVCNYCRNYKPTAYLGMKKLQQDLAPFRSGDGRADCIVAFSGGRDSSYGLHLLKNKLGMNPVAFTYDWGLVTDLARRNQARICGKLGIEHIIISADIRKKRKNVRKNVEAWLKQPDLGMLPLFMAGDKQFFYYANKLRKDLGIGLVVFCTNPLERTGFKTGFCGVAESGQYSYTIPLYKSLKLAAYYAKRYLTNPAYINSSLMDSFHAFLATFFMPKNYLQPFHYLPWNEQEIEDTLINEYGWETDPSCSTTWRIGDGTAAFYNYIYYNLAGLSENDTFRSNQIREGQITREIALQIVQQDNQTRWDALKWYAHTIGFNFDEALTVINSTEKRYNQVGL